MDSDDTTLPAGSKPRAVRKPPVPKPAATGRTAAGAKTAPRAPRVPAPAPKPTIALVVEGSEPVSAAKPAMLKKKDLVDQVVQAVGGKKKGVKEIVDATLAALGDALSRGDGLNLPPLGRAHVNRQRDLDGGEMMIVKLRRDTDGAPKKQKIRPDDENKE